MIKRECLLCHPFNNRVTRMKPVEERQRYRIKDSHRNQSFVGIIKRDPNTYGWTWKGHIDFEDGHEFAFVSQRSFSTKVEAEDYMRQFARDRIDSRLNLR
jgi:hypothetical protein